MGTETFASLNDIVAVWNSLLDYANSPDTLPPPAVAATTQSSPVSPSYCTRNVHIKQQLVLLYTYSNSWYCCTHIVTVGIAVHI